MILVLLLIDRGTKYAFYDLRIGESLFFFTPVFNHGISRGIHINQIVIWCISLLALWFFVYLYYKKAVSTWIFILLIAGTLGNLVDRLFLWGVRDFISLWTFPVFNIADCCSTLFDQKRDFPLKFLYKNVNYKTSKFILSIIYYTLCNTKEL